MTNLPISTYIVNSLNLISITGLLLLLVACSNNGANNPSDPSNADFLTSQIISVAATNAANSGSTSSAATTIYLYDFSGTSTGNLGNRSTTTSTCATNKPSGLSCTTIRAFLSYTGDDIAGFGTNYGLDVSLPVKGPTGTQIKSSWSAMLAGGTIDTSLQSAGLTNVGANNYWTGSNSNGTISAQNCSNWTSSSLEGDFGQGSQTATAWIFNSGTTSNCNNASSNFFLICACW